MADEASSVPGPFDVRTIKNLIALMSRHDLSEIDLREGNLRIRLRRGAMVTTITPVGLPPVQAAPGPVAAPRQNGKKTNLPNRSMKSRVRPSAPSMSPPIQVPTPTWGSDRASLLPRSSVSLRR